MLRQALVFLVLTYSSVAQQATRVEGRVTTPAGEPVAKATVRLNNIQAPPKGPVYVEATSKDGHFAVENIAPGRYTAIAQRPGYAPSANAAGTVPLLYVEVAAGETTTGVELHLTPLATISGTVTDADGDPAFSAQVHLIRFAFNQGRSLFNLRSSTNVDDRGMFRLPNVLPGRYYLLASSSSQALVAPNEIRGPLLPQCSRRS